MSGADRGGRGGAEGEGVNLKTLWKKRKGVGKVGGGRFGDEA